MKLNYAPQAGLRRLRADHRREAIAFWAGILIVVAFEGVLMAKSWSPMSTESIFAFSPDRQDADAGD
jgi:hypothetical protein